MRIERIIFIGVISEDYEGSFQGLIDKLLIKYGYNAYYKNIKGNINCYSNSYNRIIIINANKKNLKCFEAIGVEPDILIIDQLNNKGQKSKSFSKEFTNCKYYVINSDDENWTAFKFTDIEGVVLTYGFNSKATITLSSYNTDSNTKASICLQRELITIDKKKIEPFEFTVEIDENMEENIYSLIGASALLLILGHKDESIQILN